MAPGLFAADEFLDRSNGDRNIWLYESGYLKNILCAKYHVTSACLGFWVNALCKGFAHPSADYIYARQSAYRLKGQGLSVDELRGIVVAVKQLEAENAKTG
jgi:hypothetical protein